MTFGEKIQKLRKEKGFSQEELAENLEVSRQSISNWERDNGLPEIEKILRMSDIFGVTVDDLLREERAAQKPGANEDGTFYVSREMASGFLLNQKQKRLRIAAAAGLLIGGTSLSFFNLPGVSILYSLLLIIGILILVSAKLWDKSYRKIWKETLSFDMEVKKKILSDYADKKKVCNLMILIGTAILMAGLFVLPMLPNNEGTFTGIGMVLTGLGTSLCIYWNGIAKAYRILTAEKAYRKTDR